VTELAAHHAGGLAGRAAAFDAAFWWALGLTAVAVVPALLLPGAGQRRGRSQAASGGVAPVPESAPRR
jgi:hypothetical protein